MCGGFVPIRDAVETVASLAGNYELPGSSLLTNQLVSKGAQSNLNSPLGRLAQIGSGAAGGGAFGAGLQSAGGAFEQSALSNLSDGLSSLFNGSPAGVSPTDIGSGLGGDFQSSTPVSTAASSPAATGSTAISNSYLPSGGTGAGSLAGGGAGGGIDPADIGEASTLASASGAGGPVLQDPFAGQSIGTSAAGGTGSGLTDEFGAGLTNPGASDAIGSNLSTAIPGVGAGPSLTGGGNVAGSTGGLSGLFNGNNNGMINGLLRSGLGALFSNNNNKGYDAQIGAGQNIQNEFAPFAQSGVAANNTISNLLGQNGADAAAQAAARANFQSTPGYQFMRDQGLQALDAGAASRGQVVSGNNQRAEQTFGSGLADQTVQQYIQNLQNQVGTGLNAAGGVATGMAGVGNAQAGKSGQAANTQNAALGTGLNALFPSGGIDLSKLLAPGSLGFGAGAGNQNGLLSLLG